MSCITKILEVKGDKKFLKHNSGAGIEGGGTYKGYEYLISFTNMGHRCGYVAVPNGIAGDYDDITCHGGVTFEDIDHSFKDILDTPCADLWIGFDAAHAGDLADLDKALEYFENEPGIIEYKRITEESFNKLYQLGERHRNYEYMEKECHNIIEQLIMIAA